MSAANSQSAQNNGYRHRASEFAESSRDIVRQHTLTSTLTAFGLGFGAGVALGYLLSSDSRSRFDSGVAHRLGQQVLDAMGRAVPDSLRHVGR